jgi:hypothetical protein
MMKNGCKTVLSVLLIALTHLSVNAQTLPTSWRECWTEH